MALSAQCLLLAVPDSFFFRFLFFSASLVSQMKKGFIKASKGGLYSDMPDHKPANTTPMKLGVNRTCTSIASLACVLQLSLYFFTRAALCKTLEQLLSLCV